MPRERLKDRRVAVVGLIVATGQIVITSGTDPAPAETALTALANQLTALGRREE
jgi:TATA-box binding protein (TBP) (component of TFIID and TFIIIB)